MRARPGRVQRPADPGLLGRRGRRRAQHAQAQQRHSEPGEARYVEHAAPTVLNDFGALQGFVDVAVEVEIAADVRPREAELPGRVEHPAHGAGVLDQQRRGAVDGSGRVVPAAQGQAQGPTEHACRELGDHVRGSTGRRRTRTVRHGAVRRSAPDRRPGVGLLDGAGHEGSSRG